MAAPARRGRALVKSVQAELQTEGHDVPIARFCWWLGVSRRTCYYRLVARRPVVDETRVETVKAIIERCPTYGYCRIAFLLDWNRKVV